MTDAPLSASPLCPALAPPTLHPATPIGKRHPIAPAAAWRRLISAWGALPPRLTLGLNLASVTGFWAAFTVNFTTGAKGEGVNLSWRVAGLAYFLVCWLSSRRHWRTATPGLSLRHLPGYALVYAYSTLWNGVAIGIILAVGVIHLTFVDLVTASLVVTGTIAASSRQHWHWNGVVQDQFGMLCRIIPQLALAASLWIHRSAGLNLATLSGLWLLGVQRLLAAGYEHQLPTPHTRRLLQFELSNLLSLAAVTFVWTWLHFL